MYSENFVNYISEIKGSFFSTSKISSTPSKNFKILKILFDHLIKVTHITPPKLFLDVDFRLRILQKVKIYNRKSKYITESQNILRKSTSGSQNILSKVNFWKSKYITGSQLPKVKIYYRKSKYITGSRLPEVRIYNRKSTSGSQNILPEVEFRKSKCITKVDFWKSKYITGSQLPEVKIYYRK